MAVGRNLQDTLHTVKLEIHPEQPDKVEILAQRQQAMDKPERFNDTAWYAAAVLLLGDMEKPE